MKRWLAAVSTAALCLASTPVLADAPASDQDMQCFMLFAIAAGRVERGTNEFAANGMAVFYFLGKLKARDPSVDWLAQVAQREDLLADALLEEANQRCVAEFRTQAQALQAFGQQAG